MFLRNIKIIHPGGQMRRKYDRTITNAVFNRYLRMLRKHYGVNQEDIIYWIIDDNTGRDNKQNK